LILAQVTLAKHGFYLCKTTVVAVMTIEAIGLIHHINHKLLAITYYPLPIFN